LRRHLIWCQRRDSNSQTPVSKTGCYSNSHTLALWCTGEDLNLRVPLGETGLQPVRFGRTHAPVQTWRKVDESNAHRSSRCPGFQDQLPAFSSTFRMAESTGVEPVSLFREPLFSRQVPYRPAHSPSKLSKNKGILVGPMGFEPTKSCS
jgi:hypothetical protein